MRKLLRFLIVIVVLVLILIGIRVYNTNKYTVVSFASRDRAAVLAHGDATAVDGQYLSGAHFAPTTQTKAGTIVVFGGTVEGNRAAKTQSDALLLERLAEWHSQP